MSSGASYPDPDSASQLGGSSAGLYVNQSQEQHLSTDPELQLQENLSQHLQRNGMMQSGGPQDHQMNPAMNQVHHGLQTPNRPTHSPQQMAQSVMSLEDHAAYSDHHDLNGSSHRKRSKVSRACDECRRKKIRCDATSENGPEACSSCRRTGARCQFSRQPMKRGPSKGYIKELADRLNTLESQIASPNAASASNYDLSYVGLGDQSITGLPDLQTPTQYPRKRTHSMSENLQDPYGPSHRPNMGWSGQDALQREGEQFSPNGATQGTYRRTSPPYGDFAMAGNLIQGSNESMIKAYYSLIHPTLPILPQDSSLLNRLTNCPTKLRDAFFLAMECAIRAYSPSSLPPTEATLLQFFHRTLEAVGQAQLILDESDNVRQLYNHLVYCQALAFLAFASDKFGPSTSTNSAEAIGRAASRIADLGLNDTKILSSIREQDTEAAEVARRLFWVVFIMDRFHASSMSKDLLMPLFCGTVSPEDYQSLGEAGYHLARAADVVGQVAFLLRTNSIPNLDPASPFAFAEMTSTSPSSLYLNGQLSRFKESLEMSNLSNNSPPHLAYQYLRIIVARLFPYTPAVETLSRTKDLLHNLLHSPISPLNHIFASLVATSLTELSDRTETHLEAHNTIGEMEEAIANGHIVQRSTEGPGWNSAIRDLLHQKKGPSTDQHSSSSTQPNMAGLQHLAAAAVGEREGGDSGVQHTSGAGNATSTSDIKHDISAAVAAASEAAAAQATAAAAEKQLQNTGGQSGTGSHDPSA